MRRRGALLVLPVFLVAAAALAQGLGGTNEIDGRRSGSLYLSPETRGLQEDDFQNPGMFVAAKGEALWNQREGTEGKSCADCHGDAATSMAGVAARYPRYDEERKGLINLELMINRERETRMGAEPYVYESDQMLQLTTFISLQSRGMPMQVEIDGPAAPFFEKGRAFYFTRRGQLDLACTQCHDALVGQKLRGDVISQGQVNGFPFYRLAWRRMASRHRMFEWCNTSIRAEPYQYGSEEYLALELYVAWRGRGLAMESPSVRR